MASTYNFFLLFSLILFSFPSSLAGKSLRPKALILPVSKDPSTLQYTTQIHQRTPLIPIKLTIDLGGQSLWINCQHNYISSSFKPIHCGSPQCILAGTLSCKELCYSNPSPDCNNYTCTSTPENTIIGMFTIGELAQDSIFIQSTNGKNPTRFFFVRGLTFTCGVTILLEGLASGVEGMLGLGRNRVSLPSQFSSYFGFPTKFFICLSSSSGVLFFGDGPYKFLPNVVYSYRSLTHTSLVVNPVNISPSDNPFGDPSGEYFVGIKSIKINGKYVPLNRSLLSIDSKGYGGTKISTIQPYTVMETTIFDSFVEMFVKEMWNVSRVESVAPFGACFKGEEIGFKRLGAKVPLVDFVMEGRRVYWRVFGRNSMVRVSRNVMCLGFVDGGRNGMTSIVIGGYQLEDNLLQFDLVNQKLGFSSSLLLRGTSCSKFNFTSILS